MTNDNNTHMENEGYHNLRCSLINAAEGRKSSINNEDRPGFNNALNEVRQGHKLKVSAMDSYQSVIKLNDYLI